MNEIEQLALNLKELPGIGPRQAQRLAYFLARRRDDLPHRISTSILGTRENTTTCSRCQRLFTKNLDGLCKICSSTRDKTLLIIPFDTDLEHIEKTGSYHGYYFVLGGTVPILEKNPETKVRIGKLKSVIENLEYPEIGEVIFAFNATPEGDNTVQYLKRELSPILTGMNFDISTLGRGLSTGSELEYADRNTLENALKYRIHEES